MRTAIISCASALVLATALAGCAVDGDSIDDVASDESALTAPSIDLGLYTTKENLGCSFRIATYLFTAHANGSPSYAWYSRDWDGSWIKVSSTRDYYFKGAAGRRYYLKAEACIGTKCDVEYPSFIPECTPAP